MNVLPLDTLMKRADQNGYDIADIDWSRGVDFGKWFFPERITPLAHTPIYQELTLEERLAYNQLYGQATNEQFIFLEEWFLVRIIDALRKRGGLEGQLRECIDLFVEEEVKHTEMFRRLARLTNPERYGKSDFYFLRLGRAEDAFLKFMARRPELFVFWTWVGLAFEEKTVDYFRHYQRHEKERPDAPLDPLYMEVHRYHMLDEVRHVQIDHHLIRALYDGCGKLLRTVNVKLLARTLASYTRPRRANVRVVEELARRCPRLAPRLPEMKAQIIALATSRTWQEATYSRRNAPQTFALFDEYPEMHALAGATLFCYEPIVG